MNYWAIRLAFGALLVHSLGSLCSADPSRRDLNQMDSQTVAIATGGSPPGKPNETQTVSATPKVASVANTVTSAGSTPLDFVIEDGSQPEGEDQVPKEPEDLSTAVSDTDLMWKPTETPSPQEEGETIHTVAESESKLKAKERKTGTETAPRNAALSSGEEEESHQESDSSPASDRPLDTEESTDTTEDMASSPPSPASVPLDSGADAPGPPVWTSPPNMLDPPKKAGTVSKRHVGSKTGVRKEGPGGADSQSDQQGADNESSEDISESTIPNEKLNPSLKEKGKDESASSDGETSSSSVSASVEGEEERRRRRSLKKDKLNTQPIDHPMPVPSDGDGKPSPGVVSTSTTPTPPTGSFPRIPLPARGVLPRRGGDPIAMEAGTPASSPPNPTWYFVFIMMFLFTKSGRQTILWTRNQFLGHVPKHMRRSRSGLPDVDIEMDLSAVASKDFVEIEMESVPSRTTSATFYPHLLNYRSTMVTQDMIEGVCDFINMTLFLFFYFYFFVSSYFSRLSVSPIPLSRFTAQTFTVTDPSFPSHRFFHAYQLVYMGLTGFRCTHLVRMASTLVHSIPKPTRKDPHSCSSKTRTKKYLVLLFQNHGACPTCIMEEVKLL